MDKQNQTSNKKEQLKQMEMVMMTYQNMLGGFKNAIIEKEAQIKDLQPKIDALRGEIEKEDKTSESAGK